MPRALALVVASIVVLLGAAAPAPAAPVGPQTGPGALNRFVDRDAYHLVTTASVAAPYRFESTLGYVLPTGGAGRVRLFSCANGARDRFLSLNPACEGRTVIGELGYLYANPPSEPAAVALYRCRTDKDHFASLDPACEGQRVESRLGYLRARGDALLRFSGPDVHRVTTGPVPGGVTYEVGLGFLLPTAGAGRHPIHGCRSGADHFLSLDPGCEGRTKLGIEGYAYDEPQASEETVEVFRCLQPGVDHFASTDPACEGQRPEGRLGFTRLYGDPLVEYRDADRGLSWVTPGPVGSGYRFRRTLGYLLRTGGGNLHAIFGCTAGADHFLSLDPGCEGRTALGRYGFAYDAPPAGEETVLLYRCQGAGRGHFASLTPGCEGATEEARLGYIRTTEQGAPPAPACGPSAARVELAFAGRRLRARRTVRFGRSAVLAGRALRPDGAPAAGTTVRILQGGFGLAEIGQVVTGPDGTFSFTVPPGTNRELLAAFRAAPGDPALACSGPVRLRVRAGVGLRVSRRKLRNGQRVRFRGTVRGGPIPTTGKLVVLQAHDRKRWRTFKTTRTTTRGTYRASYRFVRTTRTRTFRFRARVPVEAAFPYARGTSRTVRVKVRGGRVRRAKG